MAQYLELRDIRFTYHEESIAVWDGLSCHFQKNTINLLLGPSGSGKSSLLYLIDGLIPNSLSGELSGEILLEGESIIRKEPRELAHRIGLVFQDPDTQFCAFYVEDELAFGMGTWDQEPFAGHVSADASDVHARGEKGRARGACDGQPRPRRKTNPHVL